MDEKEIIKRVKEQINPTNIKFLIWCGKGLVRSFDLLVVLKRRAEVRPCEPSKSKLEMLVVNNDEFKRRLELLDPAVTDPLIIGSPLLGNKEELARLRTEVTLSDSNKAPREVIDFLRRQAHKRLENAGRLLKRRSETNLLSVLAELFSSLSYRAFAQYYGNGPETNDSIFFLPITFDHLLAIDGQVLLKETLEVLKGTESGRELSRNQAVDLFKRSQALLGVVI